MSGPIGVGFIGAGAVVQSVHLPTLARLADRFRVQAIWDIDPAISGMLADRTGAKAAPDIDALLSDPGVDVVAVCTPAGWHADHVIAAMRAGKRAVLCEKPLVHSMADVARIAQAARETGVPLLVGTMHLFDPAWHAVGRAMIGSEGQAGFVRSSIVLPFNDRFEQAAYEPIAKAAPPPATGDRRLRIARSGMLELAIHDLPIVRAFLPVEEKVVVTAAHAFEPFGYAMTLRAGKVLVDLFAHISRQWKPRWEFEAIWERSALHIEFTPSFVHAGSGTARVSRQGIVTVYENAEHNGYEGEWAAMAALVAGDSSCAPDIEASIADIALALDIADQACALMEREATA